VLKSVQLDARVGTVAEFLKKVQETVNEKTLNVQSFVSTCAVTFEPLNLPAV
jgi:hypothetical protein